eukprot:8217014-Pyramimonas_sp.AAC.1
MPPAAKRPRLAALDIVSASLGASLAGAAKILRAALDRHEFSEDDPLPSAKQLGRKLDAFA